MKPIKAPANQSPGARSVPGSSLTPNAFGSPVEIAGGFAPAGVNFHPQGPAQVNYYNGAQPPPVGGGGKAAAQVKSGPMERG